VAGGASRRQGDARPARWAEIAVPAGWRRRRRPSEHGRGDARHPIDELRHALREPLREFDLIAARGGRGHILTQRDREVRRSVDPALYRKRNLVERFFSKLKNFRKIATRYEKTAGNYLAVVCSRLWMRAHEPAT